MCMSDSVMLCFVQGLDNKERDVKEHKLQVVKNKFLRKSRSSGNFGSAGARSAPSTPQGLLGTSSGTFTDHLSQPSSPGYITPSIQRSPSHSLFGKYDKGTLKQLSSSTPAMTAQAQSPEPPSPKTTSSKEEKHHTTSKGRQKKFHRHFPMVDIDEKVLNHYSCALLGDILLQGQLYITNNYFAFYSNVFGYVTKLLIPMLSVEKLTKEKTAKIIPNAVGITTAEDKHVFGSLMSRDSTFRYMITVWERARNAQQLLEPEILPIEHNSDSDSSETREESGRESAASEINARFTKCIIKTEIRKSIDCVDNPSMLINKKLSEEAGITTYFSKQRLLIFASTLILVLLFFSAAILLYRIGRIQQRYSLALQDYLSIPQNEDVYSEILNWQTHLHSKSAGAVHSFLDTNLDQIAKVRQSLEALSTLLMPNDSNVNHSVQSTQDQQES
ncbi:GRAM domain-containing protein 2A-like isoform X2 [Onthophagus taurus]|uniref:GRAM domain-containing protein 2A-like isoform X2 n=1 Tax=Onthophagus taurus TaxID=166361 RepID=UPI0039BEA93A